MDLLYRLVQDVIELKISCLLLQLSGAHFTAGRHKEVFCTLLLRRCVTHGVHGNALRQCNLIFLLFLRLH